MSEAQAEVSENVQIFLGYKVRWNLFPERWATVCGKLASVRVGRLVPTQLCSCGLFSGSGPCCRNVRYALAARQTTSPTGRYRLFGSSERFWMMTQNGL